MLRKNKKITFTGESVIDEQVVCIFSASIDCENPEKTAISQYQRDKGAYAVHRKECRADFAAFEDIVLEEQKKLRASV